VSADEGRERLEAGFLVGVPGFQLGGRVDRTGIALVHEGEYVVPAPGSEAVITPVATGGRPAIAVTFPTTVEVVSELWGEHKRAVAEYVYDELADAIENGTPPA
jgi:hypothetical protein